jgi:hypothetical protein
MNGNHCHAPEQKAAMLCKYNENTTMLLIIAGKCCLLRLLEALSLSLSLSLFLWKVSK